MVQQGASSVRPVHRFGGDWTASKLDILGKYLQAYTTALKNQPFKIAYIDAFAGTGYRARPVERDTDALLFPAEQDAPPQELLDGSAVVALKTKPPFDSYLFFEKHPSRAVELNRLRDEFPALAKTIRVSHAEANQAIRDLCEKDWRSHRAVLFLDPYGMQVEWTTIRAIAATRAIDLWVLFPLGIAVNRLVTRSGKIPRAWIRRLDLLLGPGWHDAFYRVERAPSLFDNDATTVAKVATDTIGQYFNERLASLFAGVAPRPRVLLNSAHCPLYLLCFAAANPAGARVAVRIASHLLKAGQ